MTTRKIVKTRNPSKRRELKKAVEEVLARPEQVPDGLHPLFAELETLHVEEEGESNASPTTL